MFQSNAFEGLHGDMMQERCLRSSMKFSGSAGASRTACIALDRRAGRLLWGIECGAGRACATLRRV